MKVDNEANRQQGQSPVVCYFLLFLCVGISLLIGINTTDVLGVVFLLFTLLFITTRKR